MTHPSTLFPDDALADNSAPGTGLALSALKFSTGQLSPAQKKFNQLLAQTEKLALKIETTRNTTDTHRMLYASRIHPLKKECGELMRNMVLWLDGRLQRKGLSDKQKRIAREILCGLAAGLAMQGDKTMHTLHDTHSPHSLAEEEKSAAAGLQSVMEDIFGEDLGDVDTPFESMDDLMRAAMAKMQANNAEEQAAKTQRQTQRKKTAAQLKAEQQMQDADGALRTIYRQLASALHPDRETDPQEQHRKTALMKEANAAYERRDLLALLQLQMRADLADGDKVATLAQDKLTALTALLKDRVAVLTRELYALEREAIAEFELPMHSPFSEASLKRHLVTQQQDLQAQMAMMQRDLHCVQDDKQFKRWLREQNELAQEEEDFLDDFF